MPADSDEPSWVDLIGTYLRRKQRLAELEPDLSPFTAPHVAATAAQVAEAEQRLGHSLDQQHRQLLEHGNGWPEMFNYIDLLSTDELGQGEAWEKAQQQLDIFAQHGQPPQGLPARDQLLPIGVNRTDSDLLLLWTTGPVTDGGRTVSWFAATGEVERYDNLRELFLDAIQQVIDDIAEHEQPTDPGLA